MDVKTEIHPSLGVLADVETKTHTRLGVFWDVKTETHRDWEFWWMSRLRLIETEEKMLRPRLFRESRYSLLGNS